MAENHSVPDPLPLTTFSVKLLTFWTDSPEVWFIQSKAQFENKQITTCVAALPQDVACRLLDLVRAPPSDSYEALRRRLIQMNSLSDFQHYQVFLSSQISVPQS